MRLLPTSLLVYIFTLRETSLVGAQSSSGISSLPSDTSNFVPSCALACLLSFAQSNFPATVCSATPSLDCLCSQKSTSGFTFGEGALQCIASSTPSGPCQGVNSDRDVLSTAYHLCSGRPSALPNLAKTIFATNAPTSSPIATRITSSSSVPSATDSGSIISSVTRSTSSLITTTSSPVVASNVASSTQASSQVAENSTAPSTALTMPQIAGIITGIIGAVALAIGAIILLACVRRQRLANRYIADHDGTSLGHNSMDFCDSGLNRAPLFRSSAAEKFGMYKPGGTSNGIAAKIPPVPKRVSTDPNMFARSSNPRVESGKTLSPMDTPQDEREGKHSSKLLPEKPSIGLIAPARQNSPAQHPLHNQPLSTPHYQLPSYHRDQESIQQANNSASRWRESLATQFEEDNPVPYELPGSDPNSSYNHSMVDNIPRVEAVQNPQSILPGRSLTTDTGATVQLTNAQRARSPNRSLTIGAQAPPRSQRTPSPNRSLTVTPKAPSMVAGNGLMTPPSKAPIRPNDRPVASSRNMLQAAGTSGAAKPLEMPRKPPHILTTTPYRSFSKPNRTDIPGINTQVQTLAVPGNSSRHNPQKGGKQMKSKQFYGQNLRARESTGSVTSIESAASPEPEPRTPDKLSPIAGSPIQRSHGRSPVSYPKFQNQNSLEQSRQSPVSPNRQFHEATNWVENELDQAKLWKPRALNDNMIYSPQYNIIPPPLRVGNMASGTSRSKMSPAVYDDLPSQQKAQRANSNASDTSASSHLAQRRGAKLASPLKLVTSRPRARKVVEVEPPETPAGMMKLTPKRIGDDLFLT